MDKKKIVLGLLVAFNVLAIPVEAKAVVVTKITDSKATQAYIKQVQELTEIMKQTQQLQSQLENMQQSLERFDFSDIDQSCNYLMTSLNQMEKIQGQIDVLGSDVKSFEEDWAVINKEYESDEVRDEALTQLLEKRKEYLANSNKRSAQIAGLVNADDAKASIENVKAYMTVFENGKTSPVKAMQAVSGILAQQIAETKTMQRIQAEALRREALKEQLELDKQAQDKAEAEANGRTIRQSLDGLKDKEYKQVYRSSILTKEEIEAARK